MLKLQLVNSILAGLEFLGMEGKTFSNLKRETKAKLEELNTTTIELVVEKLRGEIPVLVEACETRDREKVNKAVRAFAFYYDPIEVIAVVKMLKKFVFIMADYTKYGAIMNALACVHNGLDHELESLMTWDILLQKSDELSQNIGATVKVEDTTIVGKLIEVGDRRSSIEITEIDEFDGTVKTKIRKRRNSDIVIIEKIVLTSVDVCDKLEDEQENNIEDKKAEETKMMNTKLIVKVMENRGVVTTDVHFESAKTGKTLLGNNALVRKFKSEFGSNFHSYKNGVFYGTNLKGLGNDISVFADMNDCDFYQYLNNDCIVEPLVVDDELLNGIEEVVEKRFEGLTLGENLELPGEPHKDMFEGSTSALEIIQEIKEEYKTVEAINSLTQEEKAECLEKVEKLMSEPVVAPMVTLNAEKKGIEIKFNDKPSAEQRAELKACGYRWHAKNELWYAKQTSEALELAKKFAPVEVEPKKEIKIEVNFNEAKKGIEIKFNGVPSESVRTKLKNAGYRWYKGLGLWIAKQSNEEAMALAKKCLAPKDEKVVAEKVEEVAPIVEAEPVKVVGGSEQLVEKDMNIIKLDTQEMYTVQTMISGNCFVVAPHDDWTKQRTINNDTFKAEFRVATPEDEKRIQAEYMAWIKEQEKVEEVKPQVNAFALIQEIKAEQEKKVVATEKKFNALQDRALDKNFISIEDVAENKGAKRSYSSEFNVHSRFLKKILNNPNFLVIRVEKDYFNSESIKHNREFSNFRHQSPMNKFIGEAIEENTKVIANEIMANIEEAKNNKNSHYKGGFDMKIYAPEHKEYRKQMYIQIYTNSMKYFFVSLDFAKVCEEKEGWRSSFLDSRKISDINYHIKNYKDLVVLLAELTQENNLFLASWCKQYIAQELATIQGIKEAMEKSIQKYDDFKALQYSEALKLEA